MFNSLFLSSFFWSFWFLCVMVMAGLCTSYVWNFYSFVFFMCFVVFVLLESLIWCVDNMRFPNYKSIVASLKVKVSWFFGWCCAIVNSCSNLVNMVDIPGGILLMSLNLVLLDVAYNIVKWFSGVEGMELGLVVVCLVVLFFIVLFLWLLW